MKKLLWLVAPALALAACQKAADEAQIANSGDNTGVSSTAASARDADARPGHDTATYLAKAGAGDLFEVESSQAILKTTQDPRIKAFAQMMIMDHKASSAMLEQLARKADINLPAPALQPAQQQSLKEIEAAKGKDADKIYLGAQRDGHAAALMLHKAYAANGNIGALKSAAASIVPVVEHHISMLDKIGP